MAGVTEKWNSFAHIRQDYMGFGDILAYKENENGVLAVQATTIENMGARVKKIIGIPAALSWLKSNNQLVVWGWSKRGAKGKRKLYELKEIVIRQDLFDNCLIDEKVFE